MTNVKSVISEAIVDHPNYHIMGFQVGTTEASRIWFYWVRLFLSIYFYYLP